MCIGCTACYLLYASVCGQHVLCYDFFFRFPFLFDSFVIVRCEARKKNEVFTTLNLFLFGSTDCSCLKLVLLDIAVNAFRVPICRAQLVHYNNRHFFSNPKALFHSKWILMMKSIRCTLIRCSLHFNCTQNLNDDHFFFLNRKRIKMYYNRRLEFVEIISFTIFGSIELNLTKWAMNILK